MRWVALLFVVGCGGSGSHPPSQPAATLSLDAPNADGGADVTLVEGAQGGFHVWMQYRVDGMPAGSATLLREAHRAEDGQGVLRMSTRVELAPGTDGSFAPDPIPMFMCPSPIGLSVIDRPIVFRLSFPDAGLEREITLTPHCPADASHDFCQRICTG